MDDRPIYAPLRRWPENPNARRGEGDGVDIDAIHYRRQPAGCDQQGRYATKQPLAAEASSDIGAEDAEDEFRAARSIVIWCVIGGTVLLSAVLFVAVKLGALA
jgi:hypothetical protein